MFIEEGKYTVETYSKKRKISRNSAINELAKLRKKGYLHSTGGGKQKRIYTTSKIPKKTPNGFYTIVNKYAKEKLQEQYKHYTYGKYTIEHAILEGIIIGDSRTKEATMELFRQVNNWKRLIDLAKKANKTQELYELYEEAKKRTKIKRMPKKYEAKT